MRTNSTYSISFYSKDLNDNKYRLMKDKSLLIRALKNELSIKLSDNPSLYTDSTKYDLTTLMNTQIDGLVGREIQPAIRDVYIKYDNKVDQFIDRIQFKIQTSYVIELYKKKTSKNKRGDLKNCYVKKEPSDLCKVCTYLTKNYSPTLPNFLINEVNNNPNSKNIELYKLVLKFLNGDKDKVAKILKLCDARRKRAISNAFKTPIKFKSLTYTSINRRTKGIIEENPNKDSCISHQIVLNGFRGLNKVGKLVMPVGYKEEYHGDIEEFNKEQTSYTIQFVKDIVRVILSKEGERNYKDDGANILGMDGNVKHNIFSMSDSKDSIIDFDREMVKKYVQLQLKMDKKRDLLYKADDKDLSVKEYKQKHRLIRRDQAFLRKLDSHYKYLVYKLIKHAKDNNYDHIAVEDLLFNDKMASRSEEFFGMKFSRLIRILHLPNFKNILATQCCNKDIQLTIVDPAYTSQRCSNKKCGYVHKDNRKTQEEFKCVKCGYEKPADYNAARNIKQITEIEVLNRSLLTLDKITGWLVPKKGLTRQKIKQIYDDYHDKCQDSCLDSA